MNYNYNNELYLNTYNFLRYDAIAETNPQFVVFTVATRLRQDWPLCCDLVIFFLHLKVCVNFKIVQLFIKSLLFTLKNVAVV